MKNKKMLILAMLVFLLLGAVALLKWEQIKTTERYEEEVVDLMTLSLEQLVQADIKMKETIFLVNEGSHWKEQGKDLTYKQDEINQVLNTLVALESVATIKNVQDYRAYGITEQAFLVTLYSKDGQVQTLRIGDQTSSKDAYYVQVDGNETLYLVDAKTMDPIFINRKDLVSAKLEMWEDPIYSLILTKNGEKILEVEKKNKINANKEWMIEAPYRNMYVANSEEISLYLKRLENLSFSYFVTDEEEEYEKYGFENPSMEIQVNDSWHLKFGNHENGFIYVKSSSEETIYAMEEQVIERIFDFDSFALLRKEIYPFNKSEVQQIEVVDEESTKAIIVRETDDELLQNFFDIQIERVLANPEIEEKQERAADVTIRYMREDGKEVMLEFIPYDPSYYILRYKGRTEFAVDKKRIMDILNLMK